MAFGNFAGFLDPVLNPLLELQPIWAIVILSFVVSLFITLIYKVVTDQEKMKSLKDDMKKFQKQMREHKDDTQKVMKLQKQAMEKNMQYMVQSFKPTLITFIPIILLIGWLNLHMGFYPILPGQSFNTTLDFAESAEGHVSLIAPDGITIMGRSTKDVADKVTFTLKGEQAGEYLLNYKYEGNTFEHEILVTTEQEYKKPVTPVKDSDLKSIKTELKKLKPLGNFNIFGFHPGWLFTYIVLSIIFSMGLRKLMKIH